MYTDHRNRTNINDSCEKRISYLIAGVFVLAILYVWQFFSKSVLEHNNYQALAQEQYIVEKKLPSTRGIIYASDEKSASASYPLALNEDKYEVSVVPKNIIDKNKTAETLAKILDLNKQELFDQINNDKLYLPPIAKNLTRDKALDALKENLAGTIVQANQARLYPEDNLASQILGFVDAENIGRYGIESYYNEELTGTTGEIVAEKDIFGRLISIGSKTDAQSGADVYLTIDRNVEYILQEYLKKAVAEMEAEKGSIILVEPKTGKILGIVANPDYNPNTYYDTAKDHTDYFTSSVVSNAWEPGSIMKPIVMSMAINEGKVEPDTEEVFGGAVTIQGYTIQNAKERAFGRETMTKVLENSDNIAMTWVSKKLTDEQMYNYFSDYGFGKNTEIDLESESSGQLLGLDDWREISHATMAFGQGISATPLQMVMAYAAIANNGKLVKPYLVDKIIKSSGELIATKPTEIKQVVKEETAKKINEMLVSVVNNGYDLQGKVAGYKIAGKTGTAQIPKAGGGGYEDDKFIHSFAGFFPADDPKFAMIIVLEKPKKYNFASSTTAPYFAKIAKWLLNYYEIKPNQ